MIKTQDFIGKKFNRWYVIDLDHEYEKTRKPGQPVKFLCRCECGTERSVRGTNLKNGQSKSCGCLAKEINKQKNKQFQQDLIGKKYGKLTILSIDEELTKKNKRTYCKCQCDCGNIISVESHSLRTGHTQSCGCLNTEKRINRAKEMGQKYGGQNSQDLSNKVFGYLQAIEPTNKREDNTGSVIWHFKCLNCGGDYYTSVRQINSGRIVSCGCYHQSLAEKTTKEILLNNNIDFIPQYSFEDLLSKKQHKLFFDFAINYNNIFYLVELDGEQHFHPIEKWGGEKELQNIQERDQLKNQYCKNNHIPLIRIPYTHKNIVLEDLLLDTTKYLITTKK